MVAQARAEVQAHKLAAGCSALAVSASGQHLALCPSSTEVLVFRRGEGGAWEETARLRDHEALVCSLDFHGDDRLVSCSHDRNSYVWTRSGDAWTPELVITRLSHAGLCVRWSPCGRKFAIGSSAKAVCVCHYDADRELWAPRLIRKHHTSSVTGVAWHPAAPLLATVSTDSRLRLFNAAVPGVDAAADAAPLLAGSRFGDCLLETELCGTWGLALAWSPCGRELAYATQQPPSLGMLAGVDLQLGREALAGAAARGSLQLPGLPLRVLAYAGEGHLLAGGFDAAPLLLERQQGGGTWRLAATVSGAQEPTAARAGGGLSSKISMFEAAAAAQTKAAGKENEQQRKRQAVASADAGLHRGCIVQLSRLPGEGLRFLSASSEGTVAEWHLQA